MQPAGVSCSCTCCRGNSCSASLVGYTSVTSCSDTDCASNCRSTFPACPASGDNGFVSAVCAELSPPGSTPSATVTTFGDASCVGELASVTVPVGVCTPSTVTNFGPYAMVSSCSSSFWTANVYSGSTCATSMMTSTTSAFSADACQLVSSTLYIKVRCSDSAAMRVTGSGAMVVALLAVAHWISNL